jgi:hypothetical protein
MSPLVSVGSSYRSPWFVIAVVMAVGGAAGGIALMFVEPLAGSVFLGECFVAGAVALVLGRSIARNRRWLGLTDDGFVLVTPAGESDFTDDQVTDLAVGSRINFDNGVAKSVTCTAELVLAEGDAVGRLDIRYKFPLRLGDPLGLLYERLLQRLTDRARDEIAAGGSLAGDGWLLDGRGLHHGPEQDERIGFDRIAAVDRVDHNVCVWEEGHDHATFKVRDRSLNALILGALLGERVAGKPERKVAEDGLGRVIFERDHSLSKTMLVLLYGLGGVMGVGGLAFLVMAAVINHVGPLYLGGTLAVLAILVLVATRFYRVRVFRCHATGVCLTDGRGRRELRYADVGTFTYSATRVYVHGAYTGTQMALVLEPRPDAEAKAVRYRTNVRGDDGGLNDLRDHIARVVAGRLYGEWREGRPCDWTKRMRFLREGLAFRRGGGLLKPFQSELEILPYPEITNVQLHEGYLYVFARGQKKAVIREPISAPNLFPGLELLRAIMSSPQPEPDASSK